MSVMAPLLLLPASTTLTPISGSPSLSTTVPCTLFCAKQKVPIIRNAAKKAARAAHFLFF